jgi:S-DNA-T family DNA segregation ATPase FtsK/SpoIIIE
MRSAGGVVGYLAAGPLTALMPSPVAAVPLLLLTFFGVLVVTATPVSQVPVRLAQLRDRVLRRPASLAPVDSDDEPTDELTSDAATLPGRRRPRRRVAVMAEPIDPFDAATPLVLDPDRPKPDPGDSAAGDGRADAAPDTTALDTVPIPIATPSPRAATRGEQLTLP